MTTISSNDPPLVAERLLGKVALVTGGATGIGEGIVRLFHKHGAKVCIVDIDDQLGQQLCQTLGENTCFIHCDVTIEDDVSRAVDFSVTSFGTLDIMVNNAGIGGPPCPDIREFSLSTFDKVFDVNVKGPFMGMKHAARVMIPSKKGSIISLSSVASAIGGLGPHAYTGSKHAVLGLTKSVAAELGNHGIRVNCVSPYAVLTNLALAHLHEDERTEVAAAGFRAFIGKNANLQGVDLLREDVANAVLFLASDEASDNPCFIHGDVTVEDDVSRAVDFSVTNFGTVGDFSVINGNLGNDDLLETNEISYLAWIRVREVWSTHSLS
ncbi:xanthoxin dehydrogenase-like protein [Tanacetum coccineum]